MLERQSVMERDGGVRSVMKKCGVRRTWPQLVCCALALKNLMSVNLGLVEDYGARWSKVEVDCPRAGPGPGGPGPDPNVRVQVQMVSGPDLDRTSFQ